MKHLIIVAVLLLQSNAFLANAQTDSEQAVNSLIQNQDTNGDSRIGREEARGALRRQFKSEDTNNEKSLEGDGPWNNMSSAVQAVVAFATPTFPLMEAFLARTLQAPTENPKPDIIVEQPDYSVPPTVAGQKYGDHPRQIFDIWLAPSEQPTPVFLSIHGGGFRGGKRSVSSKVLRQCLKSGISVAALTYRFSSDEIQPSSFVDVARALQTIRSRAKEWNLDTTRFASSGGSAGAGLSLWLAFHDDMAKPNSPDLIARQSTRLLGAYVSNGQCTYDPRTIRNMFPGKDTWRHSALALMFGIDMDELDHLPQEKYDLIESVASINHLTADDPPVILTYSREFDIEITSKSIGIHHPDFGIMLKKAMNKLDIDCEVYAKDKSYSGRPIISQIEFLRTIFGLE